MDRLQSIIELVPNEGEKKSGGIWLEDKEVNFRIYNENNQIHLVMDLNGDTPSSP